MNEFQKISDENPGRMSAHTPGEWQMGRSDMLTSDMCSENPYKQIYGKDVVIGEHLGHSLPLTIAKVFGQTEEETFANARLIAAAREMFELLKYFFTNYQPEDQEKLIQDEDTYYRYSQKARELIQKIEGESPHDPEQPRNKNE